MAAEQETPLIPPVSVPAPRVRAIAAAGKLVLSLIGSTSRIRYFYSPGSEDLLRSSRPMIYAFWHRYQLLLAWVHRGQNVRVLVSLSKDGEFIARTVERLGYDPVRGSSSRRGAGALLEMIRTLQEGRRIGVSPDGPRGPIGSVQPGVIAAAKASGCPVVPVAWAGGPAKALRSWDRFLVPFPFGRYVVRYGEPFVIPQEMPDDDARAAVRSALDRAASEAGDLCRSR